MVAAMDGDGALDTDDEGVATRDVISDAETVGAREEDGVLNASGFENAVPAADGTEEKEEGIDDGLEMEVTETNGVLQDDGSAAEAV